LGGEEVVFDAAADFAEGDAEVAGEVGEVLECGGGEVAGADHFGEGGGDAGAEFGGDVAQRYAELAGEGFDVVDFLLGEFGVAGEVEEGAGELGGGDFDGETEVFGVVDEVEVKIVGGTN
jgi:hypothetical protein